MEQTDALLSEEFFFYQLSSGLRVLELHASNISPGDEGTGLFQEQEFSCQTYQKGCAL